MINAINNLKRRSLALGLCGKYKGMWDECHTPEELYDLATDINGLEYLADVCTFGWGGAFNTDYIRERFHDFINGRYVRDKDGYTTALYCKHEGVVTAKTTVLCLLDCKCTVMIPSNAIVSLYIGDGSDVTIMAMGRIAELKVYGDCTTNVPRKVEKITNVTESGWTK